MMIMETSEIIQLKRQQFRWKMRKQALEKELKEKRIIFLQNAVGFQQREDPVSDLKNALSANDEIEVEDIMRAILLDQKNSISHITKAYQERVHTLILQYLQDVNVSNYVVYMMLIYINDMLNNFPFMFHDEDKAQHQQNNMLQILSKFLSRDDNQVISITLTLIANLLQEDESEVMYLIENFNLFEKITQRTVDDELLQSELFFMNTFASMLKHINPVKENVQIGLYCLILCDLNQNVLTLPQQVKLYRSFSIVLEYSNKNDIELLTQQFHFPNLLNQLIGELSNQEAQQEYKKFYALNTLIELVKLINPAWIKIMFENDLLDLVTKQLEQQPRTQKQALRLIEALSENKYAKSQLFDSDNIALLLIDLFQNRFQRLILSIFTQAMLESNEISEVLINIKIFDLYDYLIDFKPMKVLEMLNILICQSEETDLQERLKQQIRERKLHKKIVQLQYHQDVDISLYSQTIIDALN